MPQQSTKKKVVLFSPSYQSREMSPPLSLIALAAPLLQAGYSIKIIDASLPGDPMTELLAETSDALCLGVSLITGSQITGTIAASTAVKTKYPHMPVIFGGWHPSILPQQTLEYPLVDAVVVGQGEITFLEIVQRIEQGQTLEGVAGCLYKANNRLLENPARPYIPVAKLPSRVPGFDWVPMSRYRQQMGMSWIMYISSHGCPYHCTYCSNAIMYHRHYDPLPPEQVVEEVTYLVKRHGIELVGIIDDIFFAQRERGLRIAEGFIRSGVKFKWYIQDRADSWEKLTPEQAALYYASGLKRVHFGAESGSERILASINKRSSLSSLHAAIQRCQAAGIRASFGVIFGFPAEEEQDVLATVDLVRTLSENHPLVDGSTNMFTPYPGSVIWQDAVDHGLQAPDSFAAWKDFNPKSMRLPWMDDKKYRRIQTIRQYLRFGYPGMPVNETRKPRWPWFKKFLRLLARFRIRRHFFSFPAEVALYAAWQKVKTYFEPSAIETH